MIKEKLLLVKFHGREENGNYEAEKKRKRGERGWQQTAVADIVVLVNKRKKKIIIKWLVEFHVKGRERKT